MIEAQGAAARIDAIDGVTGAAEPGVAVVATVDELPTGGNRGIVARADEFGRPAMLSV